MHRNTLKQNGLSMIPVDVVSAFDLLFSNHLRSSK